MDNTLLWEGASFYWQHICKTTTPYVSFDPMNQSLPPG